MNAPTTAPKNQPPPGSMAATRIAPSAAKTMLMIGIVVRLRCSLPPSVPISKIALPPPHRVAGGVTFHPEHRLDETPGRRSGECLLLFNEVINIIAIG